MDNWNCELCKTYNDILSLRCWSCQFHIPDWITSEYLFRVEIRRDIWFARIRLDGESMTEQELLFAKFYNNEKVLVKDMDDIQLREHREELRTIAFEAKARAVAADDEDRERKSKTKNKEWLLSPTESNQATSDAINAVTQRASRMSKLDKMRKQLLNTGIDEDTVNEMMANLEKKATEKAVKTVTFQKTTVETSAVTVQANKPETNGDSKPFDPGSLSFGSK